MAKDLSILSSNDTVVPATPNKFFIQEEAIDAELWSKYLPYQLVIVQVSTQTDSNGEYTYSPLPKFRFTLPIPPQDLQLDMPIPVNLQATLTGISAQHGGAPFRNISLQGTTGIAPLKHTGSQLGSTGIIESVFAGTVAAGNRIAQTMTGSPPNIHTGLSDTESSDTIISSSTGYYQMRLMERFIEGYLTMKRDPAATEQFNVPPNRIRLAFCMWKDESVYLVEPIQFTKKRSVSSPMEYTYSLQLRAYRRISKLDSKHATSMFDDVHSFAGRDPSKLAQVFNRFRKARRVLDDLGVMLTSVLSDPINIMNEGLREVSLFLSQVSGAKSVVSDLPGYLQKAIQTSVVANWNQISKQITNLVSPELDKAIRSKQPLSQKQQAEYDKTVSPNLPVKGGVRVPPHLEKQINDELQKTRSLNRKNFETVGDLVKIVSGNFANRIGGGNATYSEINNLPLPTSSREPTDSEMDVLYSLNELSVLMDHLSVSGQINPPTQTSVEYVAGLAQRSGIAFVTPQSKFAVPFPYGSSLERLALIYLGDANRWHEIATLNGLREPYVDEVGFTLPLLVNGFQNTFTVSDRTNLYQGQTIWLMANGIRREKRHIQHIATVSPTQFIVTVDGDPTLEVFKTISEARAEGFLPATVNSQQSIYIPSQNPAAQDPETKQIPGLDEFDPLLQVSGVDLLLTEDGDLAITPDGDCRLAYGLANIVQTVKLALNTPQGALLQHPAYGLSIPIGTSVADVNAQDILKTAKDMFSSDPMFSGVRSAFVSLNGPILSFTLEVGIAGTSQFIPLTFNLS